MVDCEYVDVLVLLLVDNVTPAGTYNTDAVDVPVLVGVVVSTQLYSSAAVHCEIVLLVNVLLYQHVDTMLLSV